MNAQIRRRATDTSASSRLAENVVFILTARMAMIALIPISLFFGTRLLNQLDANTQGLSTVSQTLAVTVRVLDDMMKRVDGLEERERRLLRTPNR